MHPFVKNVNRTIRKFNMLQPGERVVVAVSGGADSLALLHALSELQREYKLSFVVAHVDHGLRPEGPREMKFVRLAAKRLGLTFEGKKIDAAAGKRDRGLNLQESAREARYEFLTKLAAKRRAAKIALGHTADDQAESVVMRILRGAGTRGLAGIPPVRDGLLIRPLIRTWRSDIESFLAEREIPYVSDASNLSRKYLRNRIRLELIPILKEYNPRIRECLAEMADMFRAEEEFWQDRVEAIYPEIVKSRGRNALTLDIPCLTSLSEPLRLRCFRRAIEDLAGNLRRIALSHIRAIDEICRAVEPNKAVKVPHGIRVRKAYDALTFSVGPEEAVSFEYSVPGPGQVDIPEIGRTMRFDLRKMNIRGPLKTPPNVALVDVTGGGFPLTVRSIRPGDRFRPLGMKGEKKVKDFFIDSKIPGNRRKEIPLVFKGERLLWVAGLRVDDRARITPATKLALKMELI